MRNKQTEEMRGEAKYLFIKTMIENDIRMEKLFLLLQDIKYKQRKSYIALIDIMDGASLLFAIF